MTNTSKLPYRSDANAIDFPSWHVNHFPASFWQRNTVLNRITLESRFPKETIEGLRARGHEVVVGEPWSEGRMSACARDIGQSGWMTSIKPRKRAARPRGA